MFAFAAFGDALSKEPLGRDVAVDSSSLNWQTQFDASLNVLDWESRRLSDSFDVKPWLFASTEQTKVAEFIRRKTKRPQPASQVARRVRRFDRHRHSFRCGRPNQGHGE
ncbi:MAG: hypothetical protein QGG36_11560 [Pirellulaceae bacterium]|nr:hypothetical protein [Pirellulaceae bacterium]